MNYPRITPTVLMALALGVSSCSSKNVEEVGAQPDATSAVAVKTLPLVREKRAEAIRLDGTLEPFRQASLSPLVSGHVKDVKVERGDLVKKGDPLVVLQAGKLQLAASSAFARAKAQREQIVLDERGRLVVDEVPTVAAAQADRDQAADEVRRMGPLRTSGAVDERSYLRATKALEAAEARLESAKRQAAASLATYRSLSADAARLSEDAADGILRAPFDGAVMKRTVEVGEFVGPQHTVVELVDTTKLRLELRVPERTATSVRVGQTVTVEVDGTGQKLTGHIAFVAAAIDAKQRTLTVEALIDNADGAVRAGHFVRARLELDASEELVDVPAAAVAERAGVHRIYIVKDGRARAVIVQVAERREDRVLLRAEGMPAEAAIVSAVPNGFADGVAVTVDAEKG